MTNQAEIIEEVIAELNRARTKFPTWPDDPIHAAAVVAEESGELVQAALQACMAIRFLLSMDQYMFEAGRQHKQTADETAVRVRCPACGDDRTGKGSLIYKGMVFCNDPCFIRWKKSVLDEAQNP